MAAKLNSRHNKGRLSYSVPFIPLAAVTIALAIISIGETGEWTASLYSSTWMCILWAITALFCIWSLVRRKIFRKPATAMIHISFIVILIGAAVTHFSSTVTDIHLRLDGNTIPSESEKRPDALRRLELKDFRIEYYPGTSTPMDFISTLRNGSREYELRMNGTAVIDGYKIIQSQFDSDGAGVVVRCSFNAVGSVITLTGYLFLGLSFLFYFLEKGSTFRIALRQVRKYSAIIILLLFGNVTASASDLPTSQHFDFMRLMVIHNGRLTSLSSLADDFTATVTDGKSSYENMKPDAVFRAFLFDFGRMKEKRMIKVSDTRLRALLGIYGRYASYEDYMRAISSGNLDLENKETIRKWSEDIARFEAINMLVSGEMMKIYPVKSGSSIRWYSPVDVPGEGIDTERWIFIRKSLGYLNESILKGDTAASDAILHAIYNYQKKESGEDIAEWRVKLERFYMANASAIPVMVILITGGLVFLLAGNASVTHWTYKYRFGAVICTVALIWMTTLFIMRWIISRHVPLSNGFETMQFMAICLLLAGSCLGWKFRGVCAPAMFAGGLALAVAAMSGPAKSIGNLMPVLSSPLLSIHVVLVMAAYSLFLLLALNGASALISRNKNNSENLMWTGRVMLYPAVFLLGAGIFVGSVWADVSWGEFWSWDPKETWALITMLVYSFALHPRSLEIFNRPRAFHLYMILAFLSVIVTYFGVNFYLGGMHSYA